MSGGEGPRLFAVVTWGASGSRWLARLLNGHPDVLCLHAMQRVFDKLHGRRTDDASYLRGIARQGAAYRLAGDVHGLELAGIEALRRELGERLRVAILTRHPVPRLVSQWAVYRRRGFEDASTSLRRLRWSLPRGLRRRFPGREGLLFIHAMRLVNRVVAEAAVAPIHRLERLSTDVEAVQALLGELSAGELAFPDPLVAGPWREVVNRHARPSPHGGDPKLLFADLPGWQQEGFAALLTTEARARYETLGYDLSFVPVA